MQRCSLLDRVSVDVNMQPPLLPVTAQSYAAGPGRATTTASVLEYLTRLTDMRHSTYLLRYLHGISIHQMR